MQAVSSERMGITFARGLHRYTWRDSGSHGNVVFNPAPVVQLGRRFWADRYAVKFYDGEFQLKKEQLVDDSVQSIGRSPHAQMLAAAEGLRGEGLLLRGVLDT